MVRARFGTLPTVNRRLKDMTSRGLLEMVVGTDRRTRVVRVTPKGERVLENRNALLLAAEASVARQAGFSAQN
jgi:DNA-binding MarR family transcriptional regulator